MLLRPPALLLIIIFSTCAITARAQRVSPFESHERYYVIVPMDGHGTPDDPYRPRYFKNPKDKNSTGLKVLGWTGVLTPDRHHYFAEVVVDQESDLGPMLKDAQVSFWDKHTTPRGRIEAELRKLNATVDWDRVKVRVP